VASAPSVAAALHRLLAAAIDLTGAERAFLVRRERGDRGDPRVEALSSRRPDGRRRPSATLVRSALTRRRAHLSVRHADEPLVAGESVRALGLRTVLAAPLPSPPTPAPGLAALLLDSRLAIHGEVRAAELTAAVSALAALAALTLFGTSRGPTPAAGGAGEPVGVSRVFVEMLDWVRRVAPHPFPVLVTGESGSGKEGVARALHAASGRRGPFLAVNCAAFPESLLESELFGARRGAYTGSDRDRPGLFRSADGGTLLLDEVGDMPMTMQAKLLRALQEKRVRAVGGDEELPVDVRIVSATNRELPTLIEAERFRADLYHRLALVEVRVPPLRERRDDLPLLARHLTARLCAEGGLRPAPLSRCALERLRAHDWPGNVRELEAVLVRALLRCGGTEIRGDDLDLLPRGDPRDGAQPRLATVDGGPLERSMIVEALRDHGDSVAAAAARIGWTRQKLYRRMAALGISRRGAQRSVRTTSSESSTFQ